jgi:hypothetical protein
MQEWFKLAREKYTKAKLLLQLSFVIGYFGWL